MRKREKARRSKTRTGREGANGCVHSKMMLTHTSLWSMWGLRDVSWHNRSVCWTRSTSSPLLASDIHTALREQGSLRRVASLRAHLPCVHTNSLFSVGLQH